jgi:Hint domain-containing protein
LTVTIRIARVAVQKGIGHDMSAWNEKSDTNVHRMAGMGGAMNVVLVGITHGLVAGTNVASNLGWRAVDALSVGDMVLTFDNAMQPIVEIRRDLTWLDAKDVPPQMWPVTVPAGALGNRCELALLPDQGILVESEAAADAMGDPFAVVPALALNGIRGIHRAPPQHQIEIITLFFAADEVVYVEGGTLAFCPHLGCLVSEQVNTESAMYDVLSLHDAEFLVECMSVEDNMSGEGDWEALAAYVA